MCNLNYEEKISPWCICDSCYNKKINIIKTETTKDDDVSYDKHRELNMHINDLEEQSKKIRQFDTGGARDSDKEKFDIEGFLSPLVLFRYFEYMHKHRNLPNGVRDGDNWQLLFGVNHKDVCIKSLLRHVFDLWLHHRKCDEKTTETIEDSLCAIIFNANAYLFKILLDKKNEIN